MMNKKQYIKRELINYHEFFTRNPLEAIGITLSVTLLFGLIATLCGIILVGIVAAFVKNFIPALLITLGVLIVVCIPILFSLIGKHLKAKEEQ